MHASALPLNKNAKLKVPAPNEGKHEKVEICETLAVIQQYTMGGKPLWTDEL